MGPSGLGVISQILNFQTFFTGIVSFGTPVGLTAIVSKNKNLASSKDIFDLYRVLLIFFLFFATVTTVSLMMFSTELSGLLLGLEGYNYLFIFIIASSPMLILYSLIDAYLKGIGNIDQIIRINIISSIVSLIFLYPLIAIFGYNGVSAYLMIAAVLPVLLYSVSKRHQVKTLLKFGGSLNKELLKAVFKIASISLFSALLFQFTLLYVRKFIIENYDLNYAGLYQSLLGISTTYFILIYTFLSTYSLPSLSRLSSEIDITTELNENLRFMLFMITPMIVLLLTFRVSFINVFYSTEFIQVSDLLYFQLTGDFFRALAALYGLWLIAKMKIKVIMIIDIIPNLLFISLVNILHLVYGNNFLFFSVIYFISYFLHFSAFFVYSKIKLNYSFDRKTLKAVLLSAGLLVLCVSANYFFSEFAPYAAIILVSIYLLVFFEKEEKEKLKDRLYKLKQ